MHRFRDGGQEIAFGRRDHGVWQNRRPPGVRLRSRPFDTGGHGGQRPRGKSRLCHQNRPQAGGSPDRALGFGGSQESRRGFGYHGDRKDFFREQHHLRSHSSDFGDHGSLHRRRLLFSGTHGLHCHGGEVEPDVHHRTGGDKGSAGRRSHNGGIGREQDPFRGLRRGRLGRQD